MEQKIQTPKLDLIKNALSYKIHIPIYVEKKIRLLCREIHNVEWSGVLFYKINGSFEDSTLQVECVDIYQMDEGSSAYTEFNMSADVMNYMIEHPELINPDIYQGLIHSHNNMATFFSGTDTSTLLSEGSDVNHFVSLIVNNAGVYTAGITRRITVNQRVQEEFTYPSWNDTEKSGTREFTASKTYVQWFNLEVSVEKTQEDESEILDRIKEIRSAKSKKATSIISPVIPAVPVVKPNFSEKSENVKEVKQGNLFTEDDDLPLDVPYGAYHYSTELIMSIVKQLLTLSVVIPNEKAIDINDWVNKMDKILDNRFESMLEYESIASNIADYLINFTEEEEASIYLTPKQSTAVLASDIIEALQNLTQNKYIKSLISICEDYVV